MKSIAVLTRAGVGLAACASLLMPSVAQAEVVTLEQLRAKALKSRPELAVQDARMAGARAKIAEAQAPSRPRVAGRVEATASPGSELVTVRDVDSNDEFVVGGSRTLNDGIDAFAPQLRYAARVGVDWNLWDFGRTEAAAQAARAELRARQAEAAQTRDALIVAVDEVYLEWLGAHQRAALESDGIQRLEQRLTDLKAKVEAGDLAPTATLPIESDLAAARLRQSYADGALNLARLAVEDAVGQPLDVSAEPDTKLLDFGVAPKATAAETRSDRVAEALTARVEAAEAIARLHDKRYNPQLRASASAGLRGQFDTLFPFYAAVIGLEIPISDGGEGAARAAAARADAKALTLRRDQHEAETKRREQREQIQLRQARGRVTLAESLVQAAQTQLTDATQRFEESAASPSELTQARAQLGRASASLLTARLDRVRAALALER